MLAENDTAGYVVYILRGTFISPIIERTLCDKEFQDDVVQQPSAAKREVSDTVEEIKGRDVINEMRR